MARDAKQIIEREREILRAMCSGALTSAQLETARDALRVYPWRDEEHRVVFEALQRVRSTNALPLREQLPAHATRMGFPDVDWPLYFDSQTDAAQPSDLPESLRNLQQLAARDEEP